MLRLLCLIGISAKTKNKRRPMTYHKGETDNQMNSMCRLLKYAVFALILITFVLSVAVYIYASENIYFAEVYSNTVSEFLRNTLASVTRFLPFSLAETVILAGIPAFIILLVRAVVMGIYYKDRKKLIRFIKITVCGILVLSSLFINIFGVCYKRYPVSEMMKLETTEPTTEEVFVSAWIAASIASAYCDDLSRLPSGSTLMPYSFDEMVKRIHEAYKKIMPTTPDILSVKPVAMSEPWTYTHISGMYFPFTGESNINTNYPDFSLVYTTAHEIAHQLGIANEKDANMLAIVALSCSDDDYLVYSAYVNAFEYIISDLDIKEASLILSDTDRRLLTELSALYKHMDSYRNEAVASVSSAVNDAYLKANGVKEGAKSYGKVTILLCSFMKSVYPEYFM